jgi:hypothetical protein
MTPMDNFYRPRGGDPGGHQPTEQFWHGQGVPPGGQDPGSGYPWQQPGPRAHAAKDSHRVWHWTVGIALAALLAGGGAIAGASLASTSLWTAPSAGTGAADSAGSGPGGSGGGTTASTAGTGSQAALLNATLNAAGSPNAAVATAAAGAAASAPGARTGAAAAAPAARRCAKAARAARAARLSGHHRLSRAARAATARCRFIRHRIVRFFLLRGVDGQFSFRTRSGAIRTLAYERGVIESVNSGSSIVVKAADGTIWSWDLVSKTVVRDPSGKISESTLAVGQPVWVGGPVVSGAKDARLIFVRPPSR